MSFLRKWLRKEGDQKVFTLKQDQEDLFFICPKCGDLVKVNRTTGGKSLIREMKETNVQVKVFRLQHGKCGFNFTLATAAEICVTIPMENYLTFKGESK